MSLSSVGEAKKLQRSTTMPQNDEKCRKISARRAPGGSGGLAGDHSGTVGIRSAADAPKRLKGMAFLTMPLR